MKNLDLRRLIPAGIVFFGVVLALHCVGPLSNDSSWAERILTTAFTTVIFLVLMALFGQHNAGRARPVLVLDDDVAAHVDSLLAQNQKVRAVKVVRDATGADLQTAVNTVEARTTSASASRTGETDRSTGS